MENKESMCVCLLPLLQPRVFVWRGRNGISGRKKGRRGNKITKLCVLSMEVLRLPLSHPIMELKIRGRCVSMCSEGKLNDL